jgi:group II intron reverse transcriptase/maturase
MGRQESDDRVVPEGRRKTHRAEESRQGKAVTVSKQAEQLGLFTETAENPQGAEVEVAASRLAANRTEVPKSAEGKSGVLSPMTMEEIADETNLRTAFRKVAANRGAPGPDRQTIEEVREHLDGCLTALHRSLLDETYRVGDIRRVWIPKASGGKRGLGIPNVIDRIVQQAVHQVLSPHYERTFHDGSHGFRPGRSCHTAIKQAKTHLEAGYDWVVDIDLAKFFDEVNHDRLMSKLEQRIADRRVLSLIRQMLRARVVMPDGVVSASERGTPQGGPLSPLLSNIVLDELDQELAVRGHRFVRYADDCNVYVKSERSGQRVMASLVRFIEKRLRLKVNADKSKVAKPQECSFLSLRLWRLKANGRVNVLLTDRALQRVNDELKALTPRNWGQSLDECIRRVNVYLRGWLGYFAVCDAKQAASLGRIDAHLRRRLRAILLKQWKRKWMMIRKLVALGVPAPLARVDLYVKRRSWWSLSEKRAVCRGLTNDYFERRGLFELRAHWERYHARIWDIGSEQLALLPR